MADLPKVHETVVHMLADAAARAPDAVAVQCEDRGLTYREYVRCVGGFAAELRELGARGERIALICGNSLEMAVAIYAVQAAGAQAVPINPLYTERELSHLFEDSSPTVLIHDEAIAETVVPLAERHGIGHTISLGGEHGRLLDTWKDDVAAVLPGPLPAADDLASLQYTGGTTGLPKGVDLAHRQISVNVSQREANMPTRADDEVVLNVMPLFHVFALTFFYLAVYCRGRFVILPGYRPDTLLAALEAERATRLPAGPTVYNGLLAYEGFADTDFSALRSCYSGSAPLPEETLARWQEITGTPVYEGYGMSEAGPVVTFTTEEAGIVPGSVGTVLPQTEVEIVDANDGTKVLGVGEQGEIRVRGPQIMSGYRNRPDETAKALRGGWLYTGDIGELDDEGRLYIRDRKKDMAIVGGYNVYPREIDEVLYAHDAVFEAAAIGVPDDYRGEVIAAFVVPKENEDADREALLAHCRANLAKYKVPARLELVSQLPKTTVGKIDKLALRKMAADLPVAE